MSRATKDPIVIGVAFLWRTVSSTQFALAVILLLACVGLAGVLLPQVPQEMVSDPAYHTWWLQYVARPVVGPLVEPLDFFGLLDVFHSPWITTPFALLVIGIIACTARRLTAVRALARAETTDHPLDYYRGHQAVIINSGLEVHGAADAAQKTITLNHYELNRSERDGRIYLAADKHRLSAFGTMVSHLGLVVLLVGAVIGMQYGFRVDGFTVTEGDTVDVGHGTGLSLTLVAFNDQYWPDGTPKDFRSEVVVAAEGEPAITGVIRVNHPLDYHGVRFYQSYFGPAARMTVSDNMGKVLYDGTLALSGTLGEVPPRPSGIISLQSSDIAIGVVGSAASSDSAIGPGQIGVQLYVASTGAPLDWSILDAGTTAEVGSLSIHYESAAQFSGFQVKHDPGVTLVWIGSAMLVAGMAVTLYLPRRRLRLLFEVQGAGSRVFVSSGSGASPNTQKEYDTMLNLLNVSITGRPTASGGRHSN